MNLWSTKEIKCNYNHYYQRECYGFQFTKDGNLTESKNINLNIINNDYINYRSSFCSCGCWDYSETLEDIEETIAHELESSKFFSDVCHFNNFLLFFFRFFYKFSFYNENYNRKRL